MCYCVLKIGIAFACSFFFFFFSFSFFGFDCHQLPFAIVAGSVADVQTAIEHIFPLVYEFRKKRMVEAAPPPADVYDPDNEDELDKIIGKYGGSARPTNGECNATKKKAIKRKYPFGMAENDPHIDNMIVSDDDINDLDEDDDMDDL